MVTDVVTFERERIEMMARSVTADDYNTMQRFIMPMQEYIEFARSRSAVLAADFVQRAFIARKEMKLSADAFAYVVALMSFYLPAGGGRLQ